MGGQEQGVFGGSAAAGYKIVLVDAVAPLGQHLDLQPGGPAERSEEADDRTVRQARTAVKCDKVMGGGEEIEGHDHGLYGTHRTRATSLAREQSVAVAGTESRVLPRSLACVMLPAAGACGAARHEPQASPSPSTIGEAYDAAHPGLLPPGLKRLEVSEREIARRIRARLSPAVQLLLPAYLPAGYGLAAPFISIGSGGVLPNPQAWAAGYRVSYTDLHGMITVMVGSQRRPGEGSWEPVAGTWRGRALAVRHSGALTVVTAAGNDPVVTVSVTGTDRAVAVRMLASLRGVTAGP